MTDPNPSAPSLHDAIAADRFRRSRGLWRILALVAAVVAVLALVGRFAWFNPPVGDRIARITISGTITTDAARSRTIDALIEDDAIKAVIVAINSPGGTTAGGEELYEDLRRLGASKPVVSTIGELGASAAYMTAIASDHILARRLSIIGSIGVLYQHINAGKLLDTIGVDLDKVASGPLKAEPDYDEPMNAQVRASITDLVEDSFDWFVDVVAERRELTRAQVLDLADGRIMTGRIGVETGLIDAIGGETEALAWLAETHGIDSELGIVGVWPKPSDNWSLLGNLIGNGARGALGLPEQGPLMLDGLVSLWQVDPTP